MLNIHVGGPTLTSVLSVGPGMTSNLTAVQELKPKQNTSGQTIVTTNVNGQVRLHLSAGTGTFYTDLEGWFGP